MPIPTPFHTKTAALNESYQWRNWSGYLTPWCDEAGKVIDDGTVARMAEDRFRITPAGIWP